MTKEPLNSPEAFVNSELAKKLRKEFNIKPLSPREQNASRARFERFKKTSEYERAISPTFCR